MLAFSLRELIAFVRRRPGGFPSTVCVACCALVEQSSSEYSQTRRRAARDSTADPRSDSCGRVAMNHAYATCERLSCGLRRVTQVSNQSSVSR